MRLYWQFMNSIYYQTVGAMHLNQPHSGVSLVEIIIEKDIKAA
jgi:hypothetical protein